VPWSRHDPRASTALRVKYLQSLGPCCPSRASPEPHPAHQSSAARDPQRHLVALVVAPASGPEQSRLAISLLLPRRRQRAFYESACEGAYCCRPTHHAPPAAVPRRPSYASIHPPSAAPALEHARRPHCPSPAAVTAHQLRQPRRHTYRAAYKASVPAARLRPGPVS
jgi:hypothetical protein